jgi:hypothetical protein
VHKCGGVRALVSLMAHRPPDDRAAEAAVGALANLAHESPGNALAIVEAGGVGPLVGLLSAPADRRAPEWAALTIQYTAQHHRQVQVHIHGPVEGLHEIRHVKNGER